MTHDHQRLGSLLEILFHEQLTQAGLVPFERDYVFAPPRKFEMDFAWPEHKVGLEVEGGVFIRGAHARSLGIVRDIDKTNLAVLTGWRMLRAHNHMIEDGSALALLQALFRSLGIDHHM